MNVQGAWAEGIAGNGIVVTILDDGLEKDHPDLLKNYVSITLFNTYLPLKEFLMEIFQLIDSYKTSFVDKHIHVCVLILKSAAYFVYFA